MKKLITLSMATMMALTVSTTAFADLKRPDDTTTSVTTEAQNIKQTKTLEAPADEPVPTLISYNPADDEPVPELISAKPEDPFFISGATKAVIDTKTQVYSNGHKLEFSQDVLNVNGTTFFPMRELLNNINVTDDEINWNGTDKSVNIKTKADDVTFTIGSTTAIENGSEITLPVAPFIYNDRTYLPVRYVASSIGFDVDYDADTKTVALVKDGVLEPNQQPQVDPVAPPVPTVLEDSTILLNGKKVEVTSPVVTANDKVYYPIEELATQIGGTDAKLSDDKNTLTFKNSVNGETVTFNNNKQEYVTDEAGNKTSEYTTITYDGKLYGTIDSVANAFGYKVSTDENNKNTFGLTKDGILDSHIIPKDGTDDSTVNDVVVEPTPSK